VVRLHHHRHPIVPHLQICSRPFPCHLHTQRQHEDKEQSRRMAHHMTNNGISLKVINSIRSMRGVSKQSAIKGVRLKFIKIATF
jgi:hypothetical protein